MKEKLIANLKKTSTNSHFLRLIVGGYIAYLGGSNLWEMLRGAAGEPLMALLSGVLVLCGAAVASISAYALMKHISPDSSQNGGDEQKRE